MFSEALAGIGMCVCVCTRLCVRWRCRDRSLPAPRLPVLQGIFAAVQVAPSFVRRAARGGITGLTFLGPRPPRRGSCSAPHYVITLPSSWFSGGEARAGGGSCLCALRLPIAPATPTPFPDLMHRWSLTCSLSLFLLLSPSPLPVCVLQLLRCQRRSDRQQNRASHGTCPRRPRNVGGGEDWAGGRRRLRMLLRSAGPCRSY